MKSINKEDEKRRVALRDKLGEKYADLMVAFGVANEAIALVNEAREAFNEVVDEATNFAEDIANEIQNYMDERSDSWLEGERGQAYEGWRSEWEAYQPEALGEFPELDDPSDLAAEISETLDNLPPEPSL